MIINFKSLAILLILVHINTTVRATEVASYNFNSNLIDQTSNYDGALIGANFNYESETGYDFASFGDDAIVSLPIELSENLRTDGSFQVDITFRKTEANTNNVLLFSLSESAGGFWLSRGFKLLLVGETLAFMLNDGTDPDNYSWIEIGTINTNDWNNLTIRVDTDRGVWKVTINEQRLTGTFEAIQSIATIIGDNNINLGGYGNSKQYSYNGSFDVDKLTVHSPIPSYAPVIQAAYTAMKDHITGTTSLTTEQLEIHFKSIEDDFKFVDFSEYKTELYAFTSAYETAYTPLYQDGEKYLFDDLPVLDRTLQLAQMHILNTQFTPNNVSNMAGIMFEHAAVIPGLVPADTPRVGYVQVEVNGSYQTDIAAEIVDQSRVVRPTGYFLAAGDLVTITVPAEIIDKGLSIIAGVHFRNMDYGYIGAINRFPDISTEFSLNATTITIANPLGGGIYLKVPDGSNAGWFTMDISNAVKSPYFSYRAGKTTQVSDWLQQVADSGAPWADFESDKFMFTVPVSLLAGIENPDEIMDRWDAILDAWNIVAGRPLDRRRAEFYILDTRLVTPAYGAGYPTVITIEEASRVDDPWNPLNVLIAPPHRTFSHEMGHNQLHPTLNFGPDFNECHAIEAETVNHTLALVANALVYDMDIDEAFQNSFFGGYTSDEATFDWIITTNFRNNLLMAYDESVPMDDKDMHSYQFRSWAKYKDIAKLFGFETGLGKVNGMFYKAGQQQAGDACPERPFIVGRDEYIRAASEALGVNMAPLFHLWGIVPSESLVTELEANYPASVEIAELIIYYRDNVAPKSLAEYTQRHNEMYDRMGYQQPRYDEYILQFDDAFAQQIQDQFNLILSKYGFGDTDNDGIIDILDGNPTVPNSPPVLTGSPELSINEDSEYSFTPNMTDDGDTDTITFAISNLPSWASFDAETGLLTGTPTNDDVGIITDIVISVSDGYLGSQLASFNIEVINTNDAPIFTGTISDISVDTGENINQDVASYFSDIDEGDSLTFTASNLPAGVSISSVGVISGSSSNASTSNVTITATDVMGLSVDGTLQLIITAAPVISTPPAKESSGGGGAVNFFHLIIFMMIFIFRRKRVDC
ncbi:MAG: putative Ig domain-containing protein [Cohaesibacteraceae bacterium]|nr:putative Ig domain-containing protein [Cohaesibacteraceae bacterium]